MCTCILCVWCVSIYMTAHVHTCVCVKLEKFCHHIFHPCVAPSTFVVNIANEEKDMGLRVESDAARY